MGKKKKDKGGFDAEGIRRIATNRRAVYDYEFIEEFEAGLVLLGSEVKSMRGGHGSIVEAYAMLRRGEAWLLGAHIPEYVQANKQNHPMVRDRKLLLNARELERINKQVREKGVTLVPLELYFKGPRIKLKLALARGKKRYDKRHATAEKEAKRDMERALGRRR